MKSSHIVIPSVLICVLIITIISSKISYIQRESFNSFVFPETNCIDTYFDTVVCIVMPSRKSHMKETFSQWGVTNVEFFDAIDKSKYTHADFIDKELLSSSYSPYLNLGRICCHISALTVYNNFLHSNAKNILIFEDDLYKDEYKNKSEFNNKIQPYLENIPMNWDYLNLGKCFDYCNLSGEVNDYWSVPVRPLCRTAIALNKYAAKSILENTSFMKEMPGDVMISELIKKKKFKAYSSNTQLFKQDRPNFGSHSQNDNKLRMCK